MFEKLRDRFTFLNMAITLVVILAAFVSVVAVTYQNMYNDNLQKLNMQGGAHLMMPQELGPAMPDEARFGEATAYVTTDFALSFTILADQNGELVYVRSIIEISQADYEAALNEAWSSGNEVGTLNLLGKKWMYKISDVGIIVNIEQNDQFALIDGDLFSIAFMDVTESYNTLQALIKTLAIASVVLFAVIYCGSRYFANKAIQPLRTSWTKQKQFVADASHELKTPLSIIAANCDALESDDIKPSAGQRKWLRNIRIGVDRTSSLVSDLLMLSQSEEAVGPLIIELFDVTACVNRTIDLLRDAFDERGIEVAMAMEPDVSIKTDGNKLAQVVEILLDNAAKYTNENGRVTVSLERHKQEVQFVVENTGEGIPVEEISKVFDRFYRADKSRASAGGHGLGLSIASALCAQIGAKLVADSVQQQRTVFTLSIPLLQRGQHR